MQNDCEGLLAALKLALPYVEKIAATQPFEMNRQRRQQDAVQHAKTIRAAIERVEQGRAA